MKHDSEELIRVGKLTGTHGVKGAAKFFPYSGACDSLKTPSVVTLLSPQGVKHSAKLARINSGGGKHVLTFDAYDSIDQIQHVVGYELCIYHSQLPATEDGEYYWCDLIGLQVQTNSGKRIGCIKDIFETGSNDVYVVCDENHEYLIPAIADVIESIDLKTGLVTIIPLDGLLDL